MMSGAGYGRGSIPLLMQEAGSCLGRGDLARAEECCRRLLKIAPGFPDVLNLSGIVAAEKGDYGRAERQIRKAIEANPLAPGFHNSLGIVFERQRRYREALVAFDKAVRLAPAFQVAHFNRGNVLKALGRLDEAVLAYEQAIRLNPRYAEAQTNLAETLVALGRLDEAGRMAARAVSSNPRLVNAHIVMGNVFTHQGKPEKAAAAYRKAMELDPANAEAHCNFANCMKDLGEWREAERNYRRALELRPDYAGAHSNLIFLHAALQDLAPGRMLEEQRAWDRAHGAAGRASPLPSRPPADHAGRRLRIGYVSPDFRCHPVAFFFEPLLEAHDREAFEIFCYANVEKPDVVTERLQGLAEHWRFVTALDDRRLAETIHADGIDILVDLAGHTANNRLRAFTYRPAPVQATYLGFFAGTGLEAMDYWITDEVLHPADTEELAVERIWRLPRSAFCYRSPVDLPEVAPCPHADEAVTFGSFNHLSKLTPETIEAWSRILLALPGSRLLMMFKPGEEAETRRALLDRFAVHGVSAERIEIRDSVPFEAYLHTYAEVDIVLDTFPRTGGTTTIQALLMGVPVITLAGRRYAGRISASKLAAIGREDLMARDVDEYMEKAIALARDPARRSSLRAGLREAVLRSPLADGPGLARAMEDVYRAMWKERTAP